VIILRDTHYCGLSSETDLVLSLRCISFKALFYMFRKDEVEITKVLGENTNGEGK
jgi:hypothetical protein